MKRTIILDFPDDVSFPNQFEGNDFCRHSCPFNISSDEACDEYCYMCGRETIRGGACPMSKESVSIKYVYWKNTKQIEAMWGDI